MFWFVLLLSVPLFQPACGLIAPMKTANGEIDVDSVSNHVLLLEQMFSDFKEEKADMKNEMDVLKADTNSMKSEIATLKLENTRLEQEHAFVNTFVKSANSTLGCAGPEISYEVVQTPGGKHPVLAGSTLILNNVTHNAGGGYHSGSGIFRAPEGGTYLFWAHIMESEGRALNVDLMKEGVLVSRGYTPAGTLYGTASITTLVDVNRSDDLWFKVEYAGSIFGYSQSSYGGILLCKH